MGARLAVVAALLLLLAGCGSDDAEPGSAAGSPSATTTPSVSSSTAPTTSTAPTAPAVPADDTVSGMSAAEFRFRNSQSNHWRAYMLKRPMDR